MSDEKTEEATPQKLLDARMRGQVPRSQDWSSACSLSLALLALSAMLPGLLTSLREGLSFGLTHLGELQVVPPMGWAWVSVGVLLAASMTGAMAAQWAASGWLLTWQPLQPDLQRLNPVANVQRWFSGKILIDVVRLAIKLLGVLWLTWGFVHDQLLPLAGGPAPFAAFGGALWLWLRNIACFYLAVGFLDLMYQRWEFHKGLRMSKYDLKQEYKQREGDPQHKWRLRSLGQKLIKQRSLQGVSKASVVITNPTHLAVALEFHFGLPAPRVVAKGADQVALAIRKLAKQHKVPVVENKPLARALYPLEVDDWIPAEFFAPVAEILVAVAKAEHPHAE